ncbi:MAG TPA: N-(5'-phosphoribosyl)anthranilate isomerase [Cytophagales bacterium]|nr:N-(5'-phosphoribosyl)anthranilate isomerase [Cytophagales bacterium]HRG09786.1 phosphoribosylanthranilate isomerase [Cyclobacteriaceae bacterium]
MSKTKSIACKVCGMRAAANIEAVATTQPQFMGFIFYKNSPRYVGNQFQIPENFPVSIKRVGVFVNEIFEVVRDLAQKHKLDFIQLHGDEAPVYIKNLKASGVGFIKVFRVNAEFDFSTTKEFESLSDFFLFDTKGKQYGGNAIKFDWKLLQQYTGSVPFFLSGGISADDIHALTEFKHPQWYGVDVNSGVEVEPGLKDSLKVKNLIQLLTESNLNQ